MDNSQQIQEGQYRFPYHHIPHFRGNHFSHRRVHPTGYKYYAYIHFVIDRVKEGGATKILDVGCGDGFFLSEARHKMPEAHLFGNDYSAKAIALAKAFNYDNGVNLTELSCDQVIQEHGLFDTVISIEVLEHIPPDEIPSFASEMARALKPEGRLYLTVPSDNKKVQKKHFQHFNSDKLKAIFSPHFQVEEFTYLNRISVQDSLIKWALNNNYWAISHPRIQTVLFNYYRDKLLIADKENSERILLTAKKTG